MSTFTLQEFQDKINEWAATAPSAVKRALVKAGKYIVEDVRSNYLSGQVLGVRTGNLRAGVFAKISNDTPIPTMGIGSTAVNRGFEYGTYWYGHGRDWVSPALSKDMSYLEEVIRDELLLDYEAPSYLVEEEQDFFANFLGSNVIQKAFRVIKSIVRSTVRVFR